MIDYVRLARPANLLLAAAGVLAGGWIALEGLAVPAALGWAALSGVCLGAAGNILNDLWDLPADRVNRPDRPLPAGRVSPRVARVVAAVVAVAGLVAARAVGRVLFELGIVALGAMIVYSPVLKPRGLIGNLTVALVAALPLPYGALAVGRVEAGWLPFVIAAWIHVVRELMKDIGDIEGDRALERRTLPVVLGPAVVQRLVWILVVLFVPLSFVPLTAGWGREYVPPAVAADAVLVAAALRLRPAGGAVPAARLTKVAMGLGLVGLVVGRAL